VVARQLMFKVKVKITTSVDNTRQLTEALHELERNQVLIGIPAEKAPRTGAAAKGAPINNAALGYIHNFGMPSKNLPARPFLEPGIKNAEEEITTRMGMAAQGALAGKPDVVTAQLTSIGIVASSAVKAKIQNGPFAPLGASTLAARRRRGRTGTKPLIDTGQLLRSISFVIRPKG
jgi:phage gpG-like protein